MCAVLCCAVLCCAVLFAVLLHCQQADTSSALGRAGAPILADSAGWQDLMRLVQRCSVVVTEDMPVDPEAHDIQVCAYHCCRAD